MNAKRILHYQILEKLGQGGMGEVYLAEDLKLDRQVAIKVLPDGLASDSNEHVRFMAEAKAAAALNHTNIATIHAIEECDGRHYLVMEYIQGVELGNVIQSKPPPLSNSSPELTAPSEQQLLPTNTILDYAIQIANGLQFAHENHILHRDIKASNIMITDVGQVKIMDFGLARYRHQKRSSDELSTSGTLPYMAPEQIRGEEADHRADIWSFGVLLYEMLTGSLPFEGEFENVVTYSIQMEEPEPLANFRPELPEAWQRLLDRLLSKSPVDRPQTMRDVLAELSRLKAAHDEQKLRGAAASATQRITRPLVVWGIAGLVLVAAVIAVVWSRSHFQSFIPEKSLTILPFQSANEQPDPGYLASSFSQVLRGRLAHYSDIYIANIDSALYAQHSGGGLERLAGSLKTRFILTGEIGTARDSIYVTATISTRKSLRPVWQEHFAEAAGRILQVNETLASRIADQLHAKDHHEPSVPPPPPDVNPQAWSLYLEGRRLADYQTAAAGLKAYDLYQQAWAIDSTYLPILRGIRVITPDTAEHRRITEKLARIDTSYLYQHVREYIKARRNFDWPKIEYHFRKWIELEPNNPRAHNKYSYMLRRMGRIPEAIIQAKKAIDLDPTWLRGQMGLGSLYYYLGEYEKAIDIFSKVLQFDPEFPGAYASIVKAQCRMKDFIAAKKNLALVERYCQRSTYLHVQAFYHASMGQYDRALLLLDQYHDAVIDGSTSAPAMKLGLDGGMAKIYAMCGEIDKALSKLEDIARSSTRGRLRWLYLLINPEFDDLRDEPRFQAILKQMNLEG